MEKITFCITTAKNELEYIKLLFKSFINGGIDINLHDIIVFVDSDNQNTVEWLQTQKSIIKNLKIIKNNTSVPVGCPINVGYMFNEAKTPIVSYLQSDMVVCKNYDKKILKHLTPNNIISATRIEPPLHSQTDTNVNYVRPIGFDPSDFNYDEFLKLSESLSTNKLTNYFFAPYTLYKKHWLDIGGQDSIYRRSRDDSDMLYRMCLNGVKFVQTWEPLVYHFSCVSSRGIDWYKSDYGKWRAEVQKTADVIEIRRFIRKFGRFRHPVTYEEIKDDYKYNISLNIYGIKDLNDVMFVYNNYCWFNKIYIDSHHKYTPQLNTMWEDQQTAANRLLDISPEDWNVYKKYFNVWNLNDIFVNEEIKNDDVIVYVNLTDNSNIPQGISGNIQLKNLQAIFSNLQQMIHENNDVGYFELTPDVKIKINKINNVIKDTIYIKNPSLEDIDFKIL